MREGNFGGLKFKKKDSVFSSGGELCERSSSTEFGSKQNHTVVPLISKDLTRPFAQYVEFLIRL
jgi:hypothetical protein